MDFHKLKFWKNGFKMLKKKEFYLIISNKWKTDNLEVSLKLNNYVYNKCKIIIKFLSGIKEHVESVLLPKKIILSIWVVLRKIAGKKLNIMKKNKNIFAQSVQNLMKIVKPDF